MLAPDKMREFRNSENDISVRLESYDPPINYTIITIQYPLGLKDIRRGGIYDDYKTRGNDIKIETEGGSRKITIARQRRGETIKQALDKLLFSYRNNIGNHHYASSIFSYELLGRFESKLGKKLEKVLYSLMEDIVEKEQDIAKLQKTGHSKAVNQQPF